MHTHPHTLDVRDLSISFTQYQKGLRQRELEVISNLSLTVDAGEIVAVVGSSGSGKSLLAHAIMGILPSNASVSGQMFYQGKPLEELYQETLRGSDISFIPQSVDYLDPLMKVGKQVRGLRGTRQQQEAVFERYGLDQSVASLYPFELSGGMARRILISSAVIEDSNLIIADEPTPGLSTQMATETLAHFRELADEGRAILIITHDIDLAKEVADKIAVFYAGTTLEIAPVGDFIAPESLGLRHPYSKDLFKALPEAEFAPTPGFQPYAGNLPQGCLYASRCALCTSECKRERIPMRFLRDGEVRCIHAE